MLVFILTWLLLDIAAILIVLYDYRQWYSQSERDLQDDADTAEPTSPSAA
jgi:hypothetical protein